MLDEQLEEFMLRSQLVIDELVPVLEKQDVTTAFYAMASLVCSASHEFFDAKEKFLDFLGANYDMIAKTREAMQDPAIRETVMNTRKRYLETGELT